MTPRENKLRAIRFETPESIPVAFHINGACWHHYDNGALQDLMEAHPVLFPGFVRRATITPSYLPNQLRDTPYTDPWGCVWQSSDDGITGAVHGHPLADWAAFDGYMPPDPDTTDGTFTVDWDDLRERVRQQKDAGGLVTGGLPHGHTFLRLQDIRGYENLLCDMIDDEPRLAQLIRLVADFNHRYVLNWMALAPDIMSFPDDLGMQVGPMVSPECFQRHIQPVYTRLMKPARDCGCIVHMHSDGDIRMLAEGLVEGGVDVINLQDLVNGIDWIAKRFAGRVCVDLDIDRQVVTPRGTPADIDRLIRTEVETLGSRKGGLLLIYGLYPGVPLRNAAAVMDAMERYAGFYAG